jgi:uncharacterized membrane protein YdbT with pleckstrin-like domain
MPYPNNLLSTGEVKALDLRPHWWYFGRQILTGAPLFTLIVIYFFMDPGFPTTALKWILIVLTVPWLVWLVFKYFSWTRTYFVVTNRRVIFRTGIISRKGVEIPLERIMNLNFSQRVFERIIQVGNLEVQSAGEQGTSTFNFVRRPDDVQHTIYEQMEARDKHQHETQAEVVGKSVAAAMTPADAPQEDIAETLTKLASLRDAGIVTAEEFELKKKDLLGRL